MHHSTRCGRSFGCSCCAGCRRRVAFGCGYHVPGGPGNSLMPTSGRSGCHLGGYQLGRTCGFQAPRRSSTISRCGGIIYRGWGQWSAYGFFCSGRSRSLGGGSRRRRPCSGIGAGRPSCNRRAKVPSRSRGWVRASAVARIRSRTCSRTFRTPASTFASSRLVCSGTRGPDGTEWGRLRNLVGPVPNRLGRVETGAAVGGGPGADWGRESGRELGRPDGQQQRSFAESSGRANVSPQESGSPSSGFYIGCASRRPGRGRRQQRRRGERARPGGFLEATGELSGSRQCVPGARGACSHVSSWFHARLLGKEDGFGRPLQLISAPFWRTDGKRRGRPKTSTWRASVLETSSR